MTEFFLEPDKRDPGYTIPMILHCPECSGRHIDEGEFADKPHHTHAWRPAKVNTHGVRFLPGYANARTAA
jgi:hypothetical protein